MKLLSKKIAISKAILGLSLGCLMLYTVESKAQNETAGSNTISYGIKTGVNINSFGNAQPHNGYNLGYTVGLFGSYKFSDILALQVEALYFQQGGSLTAFKDDTRFSAPDDFLTRNVKTSKITLHNIEVPVLIKLVLPFADEIKPSLFLGPSVGMNISASEKYHKTGQLHNTVYVSASGTEKIGGFEKIQIGATAGIGIEVPVGSNNLLIDARYRYGITAAKKSFSYIEYTKVTTDLSVNTISLTVGLGF